MDERLFYDLIARAQKYRREHKFRPLDDINLFSILNMENRECAAHSAFLYYILKPFEDGEGKTDDENLRIFMREIGAERENAARMDIRREVRTKYGRPDFIVTADGEQFVIELKIWADEQDKQLERYGNYLGDEGSDRGNVYFLTPDKRKSGTGDSKNITLKKEVKSALGKIAALRRDKSDYCAIIGQYIKIIDKLTGVAFMREDDEIFGSAEELVAVNILAERQRQTLTNLMRDFFNGLKEELGQGPEYRGFKATPADYPYGEKSIESYYKEKGRSYPALAFEISDPQGQSDGLYFFVEVENNLYAGITPRRSVEGNLQTVHAKQDKYSALRGDKVTDVFLDWAYVKPDINTVNFTVEGISEESSFLKQILEPGTLRVDRAKIAKIAECVREIYAEQCERVFKLPPAPANL